MVMLRSKCLLPCGESKSVISSKGTNVMFLILAVVQRQ
jgi:hypothetical protein